MGRQIGRHTDIGNRSRASVDLDEGHDLVKLVLAHYRSHAAVLPQGVALLDGLSTLLQLLVEGICNALLHQQARRRAADLTVRPEHTELHCKQLLCHLSCLIGLLYCAVILGVLPRHSLGLHLLGQLTHIATDKGDCVVYRCKHKWLCKHAAEATAQPAGEHKPAEEACLVTGPSPIQRGEA